MGKPFLPALLWLNCSNSLALSNISLGVYMVLDLAVAVGCRLMCLS